MADYVTTRQALDRGNYEMNPLLGTHPSATRMAVEGTVLEAGTAWMGYWLRGKDKKWWWVPQVGLAATQGFLAWHNSQLP
jgi:hypothetical protein